MTIFGKRILELKEELGLTYSQMGRICGIDQRNFSAWTKKYKMPNADMVIKIAKGLNVSADWLLGLSNDRRRHG